MPRYSKYEMSDEFKDRGFFLESSSGTRIWHVGRPDMNSIEEAQEDLRKAGIKSIEILDTDGTKTLRVPLLHFHKAAELLKFYM